MSATLPPSPSPRKMTTKRCSLTGSTNTSTPGIFTCAELDGQRAAFLAGDAAGAAVGDVAGGVEGAEIAADGHVLRPQLEAHAGGLQRPAADQVLDRIVAEQAQVSRPAAGRNARGDRDTCFPGRRVLPGRPDWGSWRPPVPSVRPARSAGRPARRPPASRFSTCSAIFNSRTSC